MRNLNLLVLGCLLVLLGIMTGFVVIDFSQLETFVLAAVSIAYTFWMGGPGGNAGTGNGENSVP